MPRWIGSPRQPDGAMACRGIEGPGRRRSKARVHQRWSGDGAEPLKLVEARSPGRIPWGRPVPSPPPRLPPRLRPRRRHSRTSGVLAESRRWREGLEEVVTRPSPPPAATVVMGVRDSHGRGHCASGGTAEMDRDASLSVGQPTSRPRSRFCLRGGRPPSRRCCRRRQGSAERHLGRDGSLK